jgi:hypothetical protein
MSPWLAFVAGAVVAGVVCFIIMGRMVTVWYDKHKKATRTIFSLNELIFDLRQQKSPVYQMGVGVDPVARRNPDTTIESLPFLEAGEWGEGAGMVHQVWEQDTWNPETKEYQ